MPTPNTRRPRSPATRSRDRRRLIRIVSERSLLRDTDVTLASGAGSSFYFDMKRTAFHPEGASLMARLILDELADIDVDVDYVGGLEMGAVPLVACAVQRSLSGRRLRGFFVRKRPKDHGTRRLIEGLGPEDSLAGRTAALLEDVTTTGGSALRAVAAARGEGASAPVVVTVLDRMEGAADALGRENVALRAILTSRDFGL